MDKVQRMNDDNAEWCSVHVLVWNYIQVQKPVKFYDMTCGDNHSLDTYMQQTNTVAVF